MQHDKEDNEQKNQNFHLNRVLFKFSTL
jgi:hypothetical protein